MRNSMRVLFAAILIAGSLPVAAASATSAGMQLVAITTTCAITPGTETIDENGLLQIRGQVNSDVFETKDGIWAYATILVNATIDPATGDGHIAGSFRVSPVDSTGDFLGHYSGSLSATSFNIEARGTGNGDLAGLSLRARVRGIPAHPGVPPCDPLVVGRALISIS